jgi:hypothetical protein
VTWLFAQVWVWSLAAFLRGSIFTWLLFVLPLKRRINALLAEYDHRPPAYLAAGGAPRSTSLELFPEDEDAGARHETSPTPEAPEWQDDAEAFLARTRHSFSDWVDDAPVDERTVQRDAEPDSGNTWFAAPDLPAATLLDTESSDFDTVATTPVDWDDVADRPEGTRYPIKGNLASREYHTPDSPRYNQVTPQVWFRTVEDAQQAGFERWDSPES